MTDTNAAPSTPSPGAEGPPDQEDFVIGGRLFSIYRKDMRFTEGTLYGYQEREGPLMDHIGRMWAGAKKDHFLAEQKLKRVLAGQTTHHKDHGGGSDKNCENKARCDQNYIEAELEVAEALYVMERLRAHREAWSENHENSQSMGHNLRREMSTISRGPNVPPPQYRPLPEQDAYADPGPSTDSEPIRRPTTRRFVPPPPCPTREQVGKLLGGGKGVDIDAL